ncbi:butyrophilin subfamily 1 member A1-like [Sceloporus undulatus]|uniref:butyrophilin subfamily 1 member A1-like n=1 Tax=Sceloporus undulatus TaxID=8520 RepID=UPI001C4CAAD9|nr:butyrophilin subfamily 1 member A1-like [Sceloporus undulatus]XP_042304500.1 butyrophilin subfamily 1 member A1-like [Sceloporus undulatus]
MEDEEGYMSIEPGRRDLYIVPVPPKTEGSSSKCWKATMAVFLIGSVALNVALIATLLVFQVGNVTDGSCPATLSNSCEWIPGNPTARVTLDPDTAHRRLVISKDQKSVKWGEKEQSLPNNTQRFEQRVWVLGQNGFVSGRHCWQVEVKGKGEWAVGVAKKSVERKGLPEFSPKAGIWGMGEYWGLGNYVAFTSPTHTPLHFDKRPRWIRVFLDYADGKVEFFNIETKVSIYTFSGVAFSGETVYPWFRVWEGTELVLHP